MAFCGLGLFSTNVIAAVISNTATMKDSSPDLLKYLH